MTEQEEWRPVLGWEGLYEVSSLGRVRSLDRSVFVPAHPKGPHTRRYKGALRKLVKRKRDGYLEVGLRFQGDHKMAQVHVLVCEAFHGPRPAGLDVAHNDGIPSNCRQDNLRWATKVENMADTLTHGTRNRGLRHGNVKLTDDQVAEIRADTRHHRVMAEKHGISIGHVSQIKLGGRRSY